MGEVYRRSALGRA